MCWIKKMEIDLVIQFITKQMKGKHFSWKFITKKINL